MNSHLSPERIRHNKQFRFNPIRGLTPEALGRQIEAFEAGTLREFAITMDAIERRDDVIRCVASKRKKAVSRRPWEILTLPNIEGREAEAEQHKQALEYFYNNLSTRNAVDANEVGGFALLIRQMMDAVGKRYAVHETVFHQTPEGVTASLNFVPLWFFENRTGKLRFLQQDFATDGVDLEPGAWMVSCSEGLMEACSVAYLFKQMPLKNWVIYCEKHGMPGIVAKVDADESSKEWGQAVDAVERIASDLSTVVGTGVVLEKIDLGSATNIPFPPLIERMDRAIASLWRGADLSTISAATQGASIQGDESHLLECDDAAWVSETLQKNLDRVVIEATFGIGVKPLAYVQIVVPPQQNVSRDIQISSHLVEHGLRLSAREEAERFGRTLAEPDEPVLTPKAVPQFPAFANEENDSLMVERALADALSVRPKWLAPLRPFIAELLAMLEDKSKSDAAVLKFLEEAKAELPDLAQELDIEALVKSLEAALGSAALAGLKQAQQKEKS